jgi:hypothetical protein
MRPSAECSGSDANALRGRSSHGQTWRERQGNGVDGWPGYVAEEITTEST